MTRKFRGFTNRDDYEKWAHPEVPEELYGLTHNYLDNVFNPSWTMEQRKEYADQAFGPEFMEAFTPELDPERSATYLVPGCPDEPDAPEVKVTVVWPKERPKRKMGAVLLMSGGGLFVTLPEMYPLEKWSDILGMVHVTVKYRSLLAEPAGGEYPHALNDCHAAYQFMVQHAEELGINPDKIVLYGESSGGQLALSLAHRLKRYGITPRGCVVMCPILDERTVYPSSRIRSTGWGSDELNASSQWYLGPNNAAFVSPEAFANHATVEDCVGLCPTFLHSFEEDCATDPTFLYASKLMQAGVYTECHEWGGCNHGAMFEAANYGGAYPARFDEILRGNIRDCVTYDLRRPFTVSEAYGEDE